MASPPPLDAIIAETLSPVAENRKQAEKILKDAQSQPGHLIRVLEVVSKDEAVLPPGVRQAASVHFKNSVKKGWDVNREDGTEGVVISDGDRVTVRSHMVQLMCTTPTQIQVQLSEAISLISAVDYPEQWPNLMTELVTQFESPDPAVVIGVLKTANGIFRSFRDVERSDALYKIIAYSLGHVQAPLLKLFQTTGQKVDAVANNTAQLKPLMESLRLMCRIFYSLNYQDLPEFFEDNIAAWMAEFKKFLAYNNPALVDADEEDEPSVVDKLQVAIIQNLSLYADKDEEPFIPFLPEFTSMVWNLLMGITSFPKHDTLANTSIRFLSELIKKVMHSHLFKAEQTLRDIVLKIVIPNLRFRDSDEERFEDDPNDYISTEVEGSDSESRRTRSQDLLKSMCRQFETATTAICSEHVKSMLEDFATNPNEKWASKDAAIHLMLGIAIRKSSPRGGVSEVNPEVNVLDFFQSQVFPELQDTNHSSRPVVKATALKFVSVFRNQFTREDVVQLMPIIIQHLTSPIVVVHTFAAYTIEILLKCKDRTSLEAKVDRPILQRFLQPLCTALFTIVDNVEQNENTYAMKCLMRTLFKAEEDVMPVTGEVIQKMTNILQRISKNPRNPQFNHYLFESIAVLVRSVCKSEPSNVTSFEILLFPPFNTILQMDIAEFTPYVFQILAQLLEFRPRSIGLGDSYSQLFVPLLTANLWENSGNVPPLSRLVQAYLAQAGGELSKNMQGVLGIFQKLVASKKTEVEGCDILTSCILHFPQEEIQQHMKAIFKIMLTRLQSNKKPKYVGCFTRFCAVYMQKFGTLNMVDLFNSLHDGLFFNLLDNVWLVAQHPGNRFEAKAQVVGLTKIICEVPVLLADGNGQRIWTKILVGAVSLLNSSTFEKSVGDDDAEIEVQFDSTFSQLSFAKKVVEDPFASVADPVTNFATALHSLSSAHPGQLTPLIQQGLSAADPKVGAGLENILKGASVTLM